MKVWMLLWEERDGPSKVFLWKEESPPSTDEIKYKLSGYGVPESTCTEASLSIKSCSRYASSWAISTLSLEDVK